MIAYTDKISLNQQIEEVAREIDMRRSVYPGLVSKGKMRESAAILHRNRMLAVLQTLEWLRANETAIREDVLASAAHRRAGSAS